MEEKTFREMSIAGRKPERIAELKPERKAKEKGMRFKAVDWHIVRLYVEGKSQTEIGKTKEVSLSQNQVSIRLAGLMSAVMGKPLPVWGIFSRRKEIAAEIKESEPIKLDEVARSLSLISKVSEEEVKKILKMCWEKWKFGPRVVVRKKEGMRFKKIDLEIVKGFTQGKIYPEIAKEIPLSGPQIGNRFLCIMSALMGEHIATDGILSRKKINTEIRMKESNPVNLDEVAHQLSLKSNVSEEEVKKILKVCWERIKFEPKRITKLGPPTPTPTSTPIPREALLEKMLIIILKSKEIPRQSSDYTRLTYRGVDEKFAQALTPHFIDDRIYDFKGHEINTKIDSWIQEWQKIGWSEEAAIACVEKGLFAPEYQNFKSETRQMRKYNPAASAYVVKCEEILELSRSLEVVRSIEKQEASRETQQKSKDEEKLMDSLRDLRARMLRAYQEGDWSTVGRLAKKIQRSELQAGIDMYGGEADSYVKLAQEKLGGDD